MRKAPQVIQQILDFAQPNDQIRAVTMNGSRVNPNVQHDLFCDYDVVCFTTDPRYFLQDQSWITRFGELIILQQNDWVENGLQGYIFLMLFSDGVRIDLSFDHLASLDHFPNDTLTVCLLDKDGRLPELPPPSDRGYYPPRPSRKEFDETTNEIFWCSNNIAKGIWRDELPYVKTMYDVIVHECIVKLLTWYACMRHDWSINPGYFGKWLERYLPPDIWESFEKTYAGAEYEEIWDSLFEACRLVRRIGLELADHLGYEYPVDDDRRMVEYLQKVRALPAEAVDFPEIKPASEPDPLS